MRKKELYKKNMLNGYLTAALWVRFDEDIPITDISEETKENAENDIDAFLEKFYEKIKDIDSFQVGHDFWLTRNRHGAGFWDSGLGELGEELTATSIEFTELTPIKGDDGKVHFE
jgi:hypothetical protein